MTINDLIRTIPDYPKPGIMFRDVTTLIKDSAGFNLAIREFCNRYTGLRIDKVVGIEARGFIFGAAIAYELGIGFIPIRKKGKLPAETIGCDYELEYGSDRIEVHVDAISRGERLLLVDDLIATGGTALAAVSLMKTCGGVVVECAFVVDLPDLGGSARLEAAGYDVYSLIQFDGH
jgi:adenine phosphoribosyltransferase